MIDTRRVLSLPAAWSDRAGQLAVRANRLGPRSGGREAFTEASTLRQCAQDVITAATAVPDGMAWTTGDDSTDRQLRAALKVLDTIQAILSTDRSNVGKLFKIEDTVRAADLPDPVTLLNGEDDGPRMPTYDQLRAFAGNVAACMPAEDADPGSEDQEALADLAGEARQLLGLDPPPPEPGTPAELWEEVRGIIQPDGAWPGGDLVLVVGTWLTRHGIDTSWTPDE